MIMQSMSIKGLLYFPLSPACFEGLCAASVVLLYPNLRRSCGLQRFASLGIGGSAGGPGSGGGRGRNGSINTNSLPTGLEPTVARQSSKLCLSPDDIVEKYRESIVHYSKVNTVCFLTPSCSCSEKQAIYYIIRSLIFE